MRLLAALQAGRLPPALLFLGPSDLGKRTAAEWLAQVDICQTSGRRPCGTCPACRQLEQRAYPYVHEFIGSAAEPIQIEVIRRLVASTRLRLPVGQRAWLILAEVEWLTEGAANALLKFLEEPPPGIQCLLTSSVPDRILPTIRSRCAVYYWHLVPSERLQTSAPATTVTRQPALVARAAGRPGQFQRLQTQPDRWEAERQAVRQYLQALDEQAPRDLILLLDQATAEPELTFERWTLGLRELLLCRLGVAGRRLWPSLTPELNRLAQRWSLSQILARLERARYSSFLLERHVAPKHIAAELLLV